MSSYNILGKRIKGVEDPAMMRGEAEYIADMKLPNMAHMAFLRSEHAHAEILGIDTSKAEKIPGVIGVYTESDLGSMMPLPCIWIPGTGESHFPSHPFGGGVPGGSPVLAKGKVRYMGEPILVVVADTAHQAWDAIKSIVVNYKVLPCVVDAELALEKGAPLLHEEVPSNLNAYIPYGNKEACFKAIEDAEVVIKKQIIIPRTINNPLEPRGCLGVYNEKSDNYTLYATSQSPHNHRLLLGLMILGIPINKLRVVSPHIGGSFGTKGYIYPDMPLSLFLSKKIGRPIKWIDNREDLMRSTVQGRDQKMSAIIAGDSKGKITALYCKSFANLGAYASTIGPGVATAMVGRCIAGVYDIENIFCEISAAFTNTPSLGAQRGSGRTEATILHERMIDLYAKKINLDPAEVRKQNMIQPEQMPFDNRVGWEYDSGDYPNAFEMALKAIKYDEVAARKKEALKRGKYLGVGVNCFVAISGVGPSPQMAKEGMLGGTWGSANVRVHPTGEVSVSIGATNHGQYHETTFAQIVAEELGVEIDKIEVLHSCTRNVPFGQGSYGSRSFSVEGAAVKLASEAIKAKAIKESAHTFKVKEDQIIYDSSKGKIYPKGHPEKAKTLQEISLDLWYGWDIAKVEPALDHTTYFDPPGFNFPYGSVAVEVEIDAKTGQVDIVKHYGVYDVGTIGNLQVLEGQFHGAMAFGIGEALLEQAQYGEDGLLTTPTFREYAIPRATSLPEFETDTTVTPTPHTSLGAKGAGEVGTVGTVSTICSAVTDALSHLDIDHVDIPFTAEKVWRIIQASNK